VNTITNRQETGEESGYDSGSVSLKENMALESAIILLKAQNDNR